MLIVPAPGHALLGRVRATTAARAGRGLRAWSRKRERSARPAAPGSFIPVPPTDVTLGSRRPCLQMHEWPDGNAGRHAKEMAQTRTGNGGLPQGEGSCQSWLPDCVTVSECPSASSRSGRGRLGVARHSVETPRSGVAATANRGVTCQRPLCVARRSSAIQPAAGEARGKGAGVHDVAEGCLGACARSGALCDRWPRFHSESRQPRGGPLGCGLLAKANPPARACACVIPSACQGPARRRLWNLPPHPVE